MTRNERMVRELHAEPALRAFERYAAAGGGLGLACAMVAIAIAVLISFVAGANS